MKKLSLMVTLSTIAMVNVQANNIIQSETAKYYHNRVRELDAQAKNESDPSLRQKLNQEMLKYEQYLNTQVKQDQALIAHYGSLKKAEEAITKKYHMAYWQEQARRQQAQTRKKIFSCAVIACAIVSIGLYIKNFTKNAFVWNF